MPSFFTAYVQAALFASTDDDGEPLDSKYTIPNIAPDTIVKMKEDCEAFQRENNIILWGLSDAQAGHDFWLTRNGHGAGFWDGDYEESIGQRLTDSSKRFGEFNLYVGDDGQIYGM